MLLQNIFQQIYFFFYNFILMFKNTIIFKILIQIYNIFFDLFNLNNFYIFILFYLILLICSSLLSVKLTVRGLSILYIIFLIFFLNLCLWNFSFFSFQNGSIEIILNLTTSYYTFFPITLHYTLDFISFFFCLLVVFIGLATNIYTLNYFKNESRESIFYILLNLFIFSMLTFIMAGNLFTLILGWELIGLTSFSLINFWTLKRGTLKSSLKAFCFNKFSDIFLLIACFLIWIFTGETTLTIFPTLFLSGFYINIYWMYYVSYCILIAASIKSAQIFFHIWLPDSMEAPVPASALIHSATLVSAGIYLLLRFDWIFEACDHYYLISIIGSITAAYGGVVASTQTDVKKLLAFSTISHCGFLFVCVSLQNLLITILYLYLHGLFKASSFFCIGSFIRISQSQDLRRMGILSRIIPFETICLIFSIINLIGLPFTFGSLYKSMFLLLLIQDNLPGILVGFCYIGLLSSLIYAYRLIYYSAFDINKSLYQPIILTLQESNINFLNYRISNSSLTWSMIIISFASCFIYIFFYKWLFSWTFQLETNGINIQNLPSYWTYCKFKYHQQIILFYIFYILICTLILLIEHRISESFKYKLNWLVLLFNSSIIYTFITVCINVFHY